MMEADSRALCFMPRERSRCLPDNGKAKASEAAAFASTGKDRVLKALTADTSFDVSCSRSCAFQRDHCALQL
jgi:hypothetical protein